MTTPGSDAEHPLDEASSRGVLRRVSTTRCDTEVARGLADGRSAATSVNRLREALLGREPLPPLSLVETGLDPRMVRLEYVPASAGLWILSLASDVLACRLEPLQDDRTFADLPNVLLPWRMAPDSRDDGGSTSMVRSPWVLDARGATVRVALAHRALGDVDLAWVGATVDVQRVEHFAPPEVATTSTADVPGPVVPDELEHQLRLAIERRAAGGAVDRCVAHGLLARGYSPPAPSARAELAAFLAGAPLVTTAWREAGRACVRRAQAAWRAGFTAQAEAVMGALSRAEWLDSDGIAWLLSARDDLESLAILADDEAWPKAIARHVDEAARRSLSSFGGRVLHAEPHLATLAWQAPEAWWLRVASEHVADDRSTGGTSVLR